jgi:hypothetical protein
MEFFIEDLYTSATGVRSCWRLKLQLGLKLYVNLRSKVSVYKNPIYAFNHVERDAHENLGMLAFTIFELIYDFKTCR